MLGINDIKSIKLIVLEVLKAKGIADNTDVDIDLSNMPPVDITPQNIGS